MGIFRSNQFGGGKKWKERIENVKNGIQKVIEIVLQRSEQEGTSPQQILQENEVYQRLENTLSQLEVDSHFTNLIARELEAEIANAELDKSYLEGSEAAQEIAHAKAIYVKTMVNFWGEVVKGDIAAEELYRFFMEKTPVGAPELDHPLIASVPIPKYFIIMIPKLVVDFRNLFDAQLNQIVERLKPDFKDYVLSYVGNDPKHHQRSANRLEKTFTSILDAAAANLDGFLKTQTLIFAQQSGGDTLIHLYYRILRRTLDQEISDIRPKRVEAALSQVNDAERKMEATLAKFSPPHEKTPKIIAASIPPLFELALPQPALPAPKKLLQLERSKEPLQLLGPPSQKQLSGPSTFPQLTAYSASPSPKPPSPEPYYRWFGTQRWWEQQQPFARPENSILPERPSNRLSLLDPRRHVAPDEFVPFSNVPRVSAANESLIEADATLFSPNGKPLASKKVGGFWQPTTLESPVAKNEIAVRTAPSRIPGMRASGMGAPTGLIILQGLEGFANILNTLGDEEDENEKITPNKIVSAPGTLGMTPHISQGQIFYHGHIINYPDPEGDPYAATAIPYNQPF